MPTREEIIRWEWIKVCSQEGCETYALRPFIVTNRAFVYSHGEVIWLLEKG